MYSAYIDNFLNAKDAVRTAKEAKPAFHKFLEVSVRLSKVKKSLFLALFNGLTHCLLNRTPAPPCGLDAKCNNKILYWLRIYSPKVLNSRSSILHVDHAFTWGPSPTSLCEHSLFKAFFVCLIRPKTCLKSGLQRLNWTGYVHPHLSLSLSSFSSIIYFHHPTTAKYAWEQGKTGPGRSDD